MTMRYLYLLLCAAGVCFAQGYSVDTLAGTGVAGYQGDSGPGRSAQLSGPGAVVLDSAGRLYVADRGPLSDPTSGMPVNGTIIPTRLCPAGDSPCPPPNRVVRRIETSGRIITFAV